MSKGFRLLAGKERPDKWKGVIIWASRNDLSTNLGIIKRHGRSLLNVREIIDLAINFILEVRAKTSAPVLFIGPAKATDILECERRDFTYGLRTKINTMKLELKESKMDKVAVIDCIDFAYDENEIKRGVKLHPAKNDLVLDAFLKTCINSVVRIK